MNCQPATQKGQVEKLTVVGAENVTVCQGLGNDPAKDPVLGIVANREFIIELPLREEPDGLVVDGQGRTEQDSQVRVEV
jgi:hypothetical protein